jgi:AraC-like DNA-binding protein
MGHNVFFIVNIVLIVVCVVMSLVFWFVPMQQRKGLRSYRISLRFFALAYFSLSVLTVVGVMSGDNKIDFFINFTAISLQTILFAFSLIILLNPQFSDVKYVLRHLLPTLLFILLSVVFKIVSPSPAENSTYFIQQFSHPVTVLYALFFVFCVGQLLYYFRLFHVQLKEYKSKLDDYYADTYRLKLEWVRYCFYGATVFCVLVMLSVLLHNPFFDLTVTVINTVFYVVFGLYYIQYPIIYNIIEPAISAPASTQNFNQTANNRGLSWEKLKFTVISEKYYLRPEINIEEMARYLKIGRTTLSNFINKEENMNFHTWINRLRIEEAKHLIRNNPDISVMQIAEQIGYSESSHFSRQFKQITGQSPTVWRQRQAQNEQP